MSLAVGLGIGFAVAGSVTAVAVDFGGKLALGIGAAFARSSSPEPTPVKAAFIGAIVGGSLGYGAGTGIEYLGADTNTAHQITLEECVANAPSGTTPSYASNVSGAVCSYD